MEEIPATKTIKVSLSPPQQRALFSLKRFVLMIGGTQGGKALPLDTPIACPDGFTTMGALQPGDVVYDEHGRECRVELVTPTMYGHDCYRVEFDDGVSIVADAEHLWRVQTARQRKNQARRSAAEGDDYSILTTAQMQGDLILHARREWRSNYSIDMPAPTQFPERNLPIPPYSFGVWQGDGGSTSSEFYSADPEVAGMVAAEGVLVGAGKAVVQQGKALTYSIGQVGKTRDPLTGVYTANDSISSKLKALGVWGDKHIPDVYLTASVEQRMALLRGLMDTDGYCADDGGCEISTVKPVLARDILTLLRSLGIKARCRKKETKCGTVLGTAWRITFTSDVPVFGLARKQRQHATVRPEVKRRYIRSITPVMSVPVKCIQVDSPNQMYLAGRDFLPTHNTCFGPFWLLREIQRCGPGDYLAVSATYPLMNVNMLGAFLQLFEAQFHLGTFRRSEMTFHFHDGKTRVFFASAANPESIESATALAAWIDEGGQDQFPRQTWEAIIRRLSISQGRVLMTTTPYNLGWVKQELYDRWENGDPDYDVIQFDSIDNPSFPKDEYERARRTMPPWKFEMFYRGRFTRPAGLIYDLFDDHICVIPRFDIDRSWPRYVGHDFGPINMAAIWLAENPATGMFFAYREYHKAGEAAEGHVQAWAEDSKGEVVMRRVGGSPSEDDWRRNFAQAGWPIAKPINRDVEMGIDRVYALTRDNKLFIFDDMVGILHEIMTYSRKLDDQFQPTKMIDDKQKFHRLDALRYIVSDFPTERRDARAGGRDVIKVIRAGGR